MAEIQAELGDLSNARKTADRVEGKACKAGIYTAVAKALLRAGNRAAARKEITRAADIALGIERVEFKVHAYLDIARIYHELGEPVKVRDLISQTLEMAKGKNRGHLYGDIANTLIAVGDKSGAQKAAALQEQALRERSMAEQEVWSWEQILHYDLNKPSIVDMKEYSKTIKDKELPEVVKNLAEAAWHLAEGLEKLRDNEANWLKKRNAVK